MSIASIQTTMRKYWNTAAHKLKTITSLLLAYFFIFSIDIVHAQAQLGVASIVKNSIGGIGDVIKNGAIILVVVTIPSLLLWFGTGLFNVALDYTVLDFYASFYDGSRSFIGAIKTIWVTIRDMANILIIGAFVYIAIAKILSLEKDFRRLIINLLVVALLINFSFFFALTAIDISNWLTVQVYNSILPANSVPGEGLAEIIVDSMGGVEFTGKLWSTIIDGIWEALSNLSGGELLSTLAYIGITFVLTLLAAIMFIRMAFILIARVVILFILLAASSFAFAAMLIPPLNKYWTQWRDALIYNSIVAPLLLILLYVVTKLMETINLGGEGYNTTGGTSSTVTAIALDGFILTTVKFTLGVGLLWAAIRISTSLSNKATESMGGIGKRINSLMNMSQGLIGRAGFAGLGHAGRNSFGRLGEGLRGGLSSMADNTNNKTLRRGLTSLANSSALKKVTTSSYDARQNKSTQKFMDQAGMNVGSGIAQGFKQLTESRKKEEEKHDKNQYDGVIDAISAERAAYNATDNAKKDKEGTLRVQERDITTAEKQLAQQEKDHANKIADETRAEQAQAETVKQKEEALANIEEGKKVASRTVEESTAEMTAQTAEISRIEGQIQAKTQEMQVGLENGTLLLNSPELQSIKIELDNLNTQKAEHEQTKSLHQNRIQEAENTIKSSPKNKTRLEQEVIQEKSALQGLQSNNSEAAGRRMKSIDSLQSEIRNLHDDRQKTVGEIEEYDKSLTNYRSKWNSMLAGTRMAQAAKTLSRDDRAWLAQQNVEIDEHGKTTSVPTIAQLDAMSPEQQEKMNKLLGQQAENTKFMAKILRDSSLTKKERQEQERNKSAIELLANLRSGDLNISDATKKPEEEKDTKPEDKKE